MNGYVASDPMVRDFVLQRNLAKGFQGVKTVQSRERQSKSRPLVEEDTWHKIRESET
jgi:hypothetical protein